jgi:hypothetical protein
MLEISYITLNYTYVNSVSLHYFCLIMYEIEQHDTSNLKGKELLCAEQKENLL